MKFTMLVLLGLMVSAPSLLAGCVQVAPTPETAASSGTPRVLTDEERSRLQADNARLAGELDRLRRENELLEQQKKLLEQEVKRRKGDG